MDCDWHSKDTICNNKVTEKWTEILQWDPYGGWENSMGKIPSVYHYCDIHIAKIITVWAKSWGNALVAEKKLKTVYEIERL